MSDGTCLVAMYHYVRDTAGTAFPGLKALAVGDFTRQLDWLQQERRVVDYLAFERALVARVPLPEPSALLTFDDGFVDHYETVFPQLKARGLSGVFFVAGLTVDPEPRVLNVHKTHALLARLGADTFAEKVVRALEREPVGVGSGLGWRREVYRYDASPELAAKHLLNYELPYDAADRVLETLFQQYVSDETAFARSLYLSPEMIREMAAAGMTFGFHTENHRVLSRLCYDDQRRELVAGVQRIRELTAQLSVPLCYPYGHPHTYNADTLTILADVGYASAFNTVRRVVSLTADSRYELPRFDTKDLPPFDRIAADA